MMVNNVVTIGLPRQADITARMLASGVTLHPSWQNETSTAIIYPNTTTDIMTNTCFYNFDTVACIRSSVLTFLGLVTALLCVMKIVKLHMVRHQSWHQYVIFYTASLECIIAGIHWVLASFAQMDFVLQYLKLIQFLVMCHFYWTLATRALRREKLTRWILIPFLTVACAYFTIISTLGIVHVQSSAIECLQPYWLELSSAEFAIVQLFAVAGFYITRRLNEISTLDSVRWSQKRDLWCIVIVFEVSAFVGVLYDITLRIVGDENSGCSAIFNHTQELYSPIFIIFMVMKLLLPIWVMLFVFQPTPPAADQEDLLPALTDGGTSVFSAGVDDQQYRQLYHPTEDYRSFLNHGDSSPSPTGAGILRSISNPTIQRSASNLDPIKEEGNSGASSQQQTPRDHEFEPDTPPRGKFYI